MKYYHIQADGRTVGCIEILDREILDRLYQVSLVRPFASARVPSFSDAISFAKIFFPELEVGDATD